MMHIALLLTAAWSAPLPEDCAPGAGVVLQAPSVVLRCADGAEACAGELVVTVRNCEASAQSIAALDLVQASGASVRLEFSPAVALPAGTRRALRWGLGRDGAVTLTLTLGDGRRVSGPEVAVSNPALDELRRSCFRCRGVLGRFGMAGVLACDCPAADRGKRCFDGGECEGACLVETYEVVTPAAPRRCRGGVCSARLATGRPVGRCSERTLVFGCKPYLDGAHPDDPPVTLPAHVAHSCRD
ncbi:MAG: hypothetical protein K1X89_26530 [Myxococcaceae bacterium]|nr:hypothetical protein [Myxococcaceae bacterium]